MIALIIIAALLLLIAALLFSPVWARIVYYDGLTLDVGFGPIRFRLLPIKDEKIKISDYSPKALRKRRLAVKKKAEKSARKTKRANAPSAPKRKRRLSDINALLRYITRVAAALLKKFGEYLRVDIKRFVITVATGDAAQTAILYGAVSQGASYLFALLESTLKLKYCRNAMTGIEAEFTAENWNADIDITLKLRGWQALALLIKAILSTL